jgi:hypothetical protein
MRIQHINRLTRVEDIIAQKFKNGAMKLVCSCSGDDCDLSARRAARFSGKQHRFDMELLNRLRRNRQPHKRLLRLVHDVGRIDAVIGKVIVVETATGKADRALIAAARIYRSGDERRQRGPVAPVQRQLLHLFALDIGAQGIGGLVELRGLLAYLHVFHHTCGPQPRIQRCGQPCSRYNIFKRDLLEAFSGKADTIDADWQVRQIVRAFGAALRRSLHACGNLCCDNMRVCYHAARGVTNSAVKTGPIYLRISGSDSNKGEEDDECLFHLNSLHMTATISC